MKKLAYLLAGFAAVGMIAGFVFSATVTKGLIGKQDFNLWYTTNSAQTFTRTTSDGYTLTLTKLDWVGIDVHQVYAGGTTRTGTILTTAASDVGYNTDRQMFLSPGDWNITANCNVGDYGDLIWYAAPSTVFNISSGVTLTLPSPDNIIAKPGQQIFTGAGTVTFSKAGTVYPEWWGIDGTSDETEINKAFASLSAGGVVDLKAANYSIDGSITPASNTVLRADPWTTVTLAASTDAPMISISGKTNVRITGGGTFDGAKTTQAGDTDDHVLYIASSSSYITVDDVTFTNSYDDTINSSTTSNLSIRNSRITNSRNNGIVLTGDSKVSITDNYFSGNVATTGTANIVPYTGCSDVLIARNSFYDTGEVAGQGHGVYTYMSQGIRIHDNYFQNMFGMGVEVNTQTAGTVVMITGNIMHQCGNVPAQTGGVWVGASASAVIANNAITEAQYHGVYLYQSDRCTVSNNTILDTQNSGYGLRLLDATYTSLIGNTVGDTGGSPTSAESISVGSAGAGPLSVTAAGNIMAGSTYNYIMNQEKGIEAAANYQTATAWKIGNTLDGLTGQTKTLTDNYTIYPGYSGVYTLDPGGAHRNIVCSSGFKQGSVVIVVNTADAAENLMFDSAGINLAVGQNQRGIFSYDGTAWRKVYIGS